MSHIKYIQADMEKVEKQVKNLFFLTDQEYANITFNTGKMYLNHYFRFDDEAILKLEGNRMFWNWWKVQMYNYNKVLIRVTSVIAPSVISSDGYILDTPELRRDYYDIYHQDRFKPVPPRVLFEELKTTKLETV